QSGGDASPLLARYARLHSAIVDELQAELGSDAFATVALELDKLNADFERLLQGVSLLREVSPLVLARISSLGERASCAILLQCLRARGADVRFVDPCEH